LSPDEGETERGGDAQVSRPSANMGLLDDWLVSIAMVRAARNELDRREASNLPLTLSQVLSLAETVVSYFCKSQPLPEPRQRPDPR